MLNAIVEVSNINEIPNAAAIVWTELPKLSPNAVNMPAFRPLVIPCVNVNMISGPGARIIKIEEMRNGNKLDTETMLSNHC